jgi:hypothetical protein
VKRKLTVEQRQPEWLQPRLDNTQTLEEKRYLSKQINSTLKEGERVIGNLQCSDQTVVQCQMFLVPATILLSVLLLLAIPLRGLDKTTFSMTALGVFIPIVILYARVKRSHRLSTSNYTFTNKRIVHSSCGLWRTTRSYAPEKRRIWLHNASFSKVLFDERKEAITLLLHRNAYQNRIPNPTILCGSRAQEILHLLESEYGVKVKMRSYFFRKECSKGSKNTFLLRMVT